MLSQGFALGLQQLRTFTRPLGVFQFQIPVIQSGQQLTLLDEVAGTDRGLGDITVEWRNNHPLHPPLQLRVGVNPEVTLGKCKEQ